MWKAWARNSELVRGLALKEVMGALDQLPEMSLLPPPKGSWWVSKDHASGEQVGIKYITVLPPSAMLVPPRFGGMGARREGETMSSVEDFL